MFLIFISFNLQYQELGLDELDTMTKAFELLRTRVVSGRFRSGYFCFFINSKIRRITRPRFAICLKLAASGIICV